MHKGKEGKAEYVEKGEPVACSAIRAGCLAIFLSLGNVDLRMAFLRQDAGKDISSLR